ncbi:hypothetical protein ACHAXT_008388 [Thalassiosira profunda]
MKRRCRNQIFGGLCCLLLLTVVALLIAYGVRLGTGDEEHTAATQGTCRESTSGASTLQVLSLNTFLINCLPGAKCQEDDARAVRVGEVTAWFEDREEDVVLLQEVWSYHDEIRDGMTNAGYCHYVMSESSIGSGLGIFSKYPISETDFTDWFDAFGIGDGMAPNPFNVEGYVADKGVLYAKIDKDGVPIHIFNLHAQSDTSGDNHDIRLKQFEMVRSFVDSKAIPADEFVLLGGDYNEDKDCRSRSCEGEAKCEGQAYYDEMIEMLSAGVARTASANVFTYNSYKNNILKDLYQDTDCFYRYTLDYIFWSENHLAAADSSFCEVLDPLGTDGIDLSDHLPVACTYDMVQVEGDAEVVDADEQDAEPGSPTTAAPVEV